MNIEQANMLYGMVLGSCIASGIILFGFHILIEPKLRKLIKELERLRK